MEFEIKTKDELNEYLKDIFIRLFRFKKKEISDSLAVLDRFLNPIKSEIYIGIESPYVDKLYRDSHYNYYSSKLNHYERNCIRLSFFSGPITLENFYLKNAEDYLGKQFLGFLVLRPTPTKICGRNFLNPHMLPSNELRYIISAKSSAAINGVKLEFKGFPHSSQDGEMMVCAEITIWSILEYFSHKYPEYKSIYPHDITAILSSISMERQIPSGGLTALQMSFAFKKLGFGVKIYSAQRNTPQAFFRIIKIYLESGIPVVTTIGNNNVGHVISIVGRTDFSNDKIFNFSVADEMTNGSVLYDYYEQPSEYLVIDDNLTPYSKISLSNPACNYSGNAKWENCKINALIIPLHTRVYMDADKAVDYAFKYLILLDRHILSLPSLVVRVLLSSSRSFKHYVSTNEELPPEVKKDIVSIDMPKFVWITELSTPILVKERKACGMLLMDATEPKKGTVIGTFINDIKIISGTLGRYSLPLPPFKIFHNLNTF